MHLPHHLLRHASGVYHFRLVVPRDLHALMGLRIIKRSLHTRDLRAARVAAWEFSASYARAFATLRGSAMTKPPSIEDIRAAFARGDVSKWSRDESKGKAEASDPEDHARMMEYMAAEQRLAETKANAAIAALAVARETERLAPEREAREAEYQQLQRNTGPAGGNQAASGSASGFSLREMITHWETVEAPDMLPDTAETRLKMIEDFAQHHGEKRPISGVRRTDIASWDAANAARGNSRGTRKGKASHLKMFFELAERSGHYPQNLGNPADRAVKFTKSDKADRAETHGWEPFTLAQLQTLFAAQNLQRTREPHTRRALVIGLYTGARVGEVAQLKVRDFEIKDGVKCVKFQGELKTRTSKRLIPLHPDLLRLGVWDWVREQDKQGEERLFPTVKLDGKSGKGNAISKGTSNLLAMLKIVVEKGKTTRLGFHSFRDSVIQELQGADPSKLLEERRRAYVGHAPYEKQDNSAHKTHYMRAWKPSEIEGLHGGITWGQWLDLDALKTLLAQTQSDAALKAQQRAMERTKKRSPASV